MFLRRCTRSKDGKQHSYYALVESVRTEAGPRQRTVAYLGELNHDQERRWQRTVVFHNRQGDARQLTLFAEDTDVALPDDPDVVRIRLKQVGWSNGRRFGDIWLAHWLWRQLHLDEIVDRHVPQGKETIRPADIVAIEVINRLCGPCSEFALAEHWYAATGLDDLLGVPDSAVTKDRLYRTLDRLLEAKEAIENDLKTRLGTLFDLDYDLLLYDLTSTYFEGLATENDLAARGYSRDHRGDCKQIILALVVTRDGFPLAHMTLAGNTRDLQTVATVVTAVEARFGQSQRVWVMDRGMISDESIAFLSEHDRRYLLATRRGELTAFAHELNRTGWERLADHPDVELKRCGRDDVAYVLARSKPRRAKERAIRRRQRRGLADGLKRLRQRVAAGRLKQRDKILECVGRLQGRYPKARRFVTIVVTPSCQQTPPPAPSAAKAKAPGTAKAKAKAKQSRTAATSTDAAPSATLTTPAPIPAPTAATTTTSRTSRPRPASTSAVTWTWKVAAFKAALARDGVYLLRSNQSDWTARELWETYMQLTTVEKAFRVLKSELLLRPVWHHYSGRTQAHVLICVLAYALWKTLDHLAKQAGLETLIHKPDPRRPASVTPQPRPMTPTVILRELGQIQIGDILLNTTTGAQLALRRVARPNPEQARILAALKLTLPERLSPDRLL